LNPSNSLQKKVWSAFIWTITLLIQMVFKIRFLLKINLYFMGYSRDSIICHMKLKEATGYHLIWFWQALL
jgi:hypothetical protein